jgi:hypothetical protein
MEKLSQGPVMHLGVKGLDGWMEIFDDFTVHSFYLTPDIYIVHPEDGRRWRPKHVGVDNKEQV